MKIGMLGTGVVGQALGAGFVALGHDVMLGSRDPHSEKAQTWVAEHGEHAVLGTFGDAAAIGKRGVRCACHLIMLWSVPASFICHRTRG